MTSTLSSVTDGQLCDDAGVPGCAPKVVVQDNAAKTVVTSNPTNVVTQSGGATIVTSPSAPRVMTTPQAVQVVVNNQAPVNVNTGCCPPATAGGAEVGGANTQIQFNDAGLLAGDPTFVFDKTTNELGVPTIRFPVPVSQPSLTGFEIEMPGAASPVIAAEQVDGTLDIDMPTVTADARKVMVVADSQVVGESIDFGDTALRSGDIYIYGGIPDTGFYAGTQLAHIVKTSTAGDLVTSQLSKMGYLGGDPGFRVRDSIYNNATSEYDSYAIANLRAGSLSFATYTSDITIVPNGDMVDSITVEWPAEGGTLARVEDVIGPLPTPTYPSAFNVADLPDPALYPQAVAVAIDAVPGIALCLSDGVDWINVTTGLAVVGP